MISRSDPSRTPAPIPQVVAALQSRLEGLPDRLASHGAFVTTYLRTTQAVGEAVERGFFADPGWVERWDVAFADLYLAAVDRALAGEVPPQPWQRAFAAPADLPPLRHVLLGMNAHINYDLPQALLAVIDPEEFADAATLARRLDDHRRIDTILAGRVAVEGEHLAQTQVPTRLDRLLAPLSRWASRRFLREARTKVWHNTRVLHRARLRGPAAYARGLAELEKLSADKIVDLLRPGQILLRLAVSGFGVALHESPAGG